MTKHIHMINGDSSKWKVKVIVQDKINTYGDDNEVIGTEWVTSETYDLSNPGGIVTRAIWDSRRIIIEENGSYD